MATEVVMPQMGYDMERGTVVRWLKREGEPVSRGEPLAEIETDKAVVEMEATATGVLRKVLAAPGSTVAVGYIIGIIAAPDEDISQLEAKAPLAPGPAAAPPPAVPGGPVAAQAAEAPTEEFKASPVARRLAQEKGIDLRQVTGTGPGGRITREDVLAHEAGQPAAGRGAAFPAALAAVPVAPGRLELSRMRQAIARATIQSKPGTPHFYVTSEVDMAAAMDFRRQFNNALSNDPRLSVNDMIVKAAALALKKFPALNSFYREDHLETHEAIHIGMAVALEQGLMVPAVLHCERKSLAEIARASKDLIERAQQGRLRQEEYNGTFSISNLGMFDVESFSAIILPPQSGVLAVGSIRKVPVVGEGDRVVVRQRMKVTISVDHRVSDGAEGARFLQEVKRLLENPVSLLVG
ncbi:MAG: 2-oxo acid dehydrogenase subunit E2 [Chloroflexi bacterium]|nr:2-oxo acid dehydrogenase subunit E2 [Chloroflexota bacterium]